MKEISTTRFGAIRVSHTDLLHFPRGLIGFEGLRRWVLLADASNSAVGWLQSADHESLAMPAVSPRRFVPDYRFRIGRKHVELIELGDLDRAFVLVTVAKSDGIFTANLRAPLVVNLDRRLGCQIVTLDHQSLQHPLAAPVAPLRKIA